MRKVFLLLFITLLSFAGCKSSILEDPSTSIQYSIPQPSHVKLTVENSYKTVIATLVDGEYSAGNYSVLMNMSNLPEGVYFYTLECRNDETKFYYKKTNSMVLMK